VLEGGTGTGAALLCLATRVPGLAGTGIEQDAKLADLARRNIAANALQNLDIVAADLLAHTPPGAYDHAMANPPWHAEAATPSPHPARDTARRAPAGLIAAWAAALARPLRHRGTLTLILGADHLAEGLAALAHAGCGSPVLFPLWPRAGRPARLVLLRGTRNARGPARLAPGLTLHADAGGYTPQADAILRHGAALEL
jgi:tRNA1(Val) A37 N6-methylase TrmN6